MKSKLYLYKQEVDANKIRLEEEKIKSITDIYEINNEYYWIYKSLFNSSNGYETINDLLQISEEEIERKFYNNLYVSFATIVRAENILREYLNKRNLAFRYEYENLGIKEEEATVRIKNIEGFPAVVLNILEEKNDEDLRMLDLLSYDFDKLHKQLGNERLIELKEYLHKLGHNLLNERVILAEKEYDENSIYIKDVINDVCTVKILEKKEIFTLEELVNYGPKILELDYIGEKRRDLILNTMATYDYKFLPEEKDDELEKIIEENKQLKLKISQHEKRLTEKEALLIEKKYLLEREKELDRLITFNEAKTIQKEVEYIKK